MTNITLYFLQTSRAMRTAWLLEELKLDYKCVFSDREKNVGPLAFKEAIIKAGNPLGKSPTIVDDGLCVSESGAITEYDHDIDAVLIPQSQLVLGIYVRSTTPATA